MARIVLASIVIAILLLARGRSARARQLALHDHPAIAALRATRGRATVFIPGSRDLDDMQTLAGLSLLESVVAHDTARETRVTMLASHPLVAAASRDWLSCGDDAVFSSSDPLGFAMSAASRIRRQRPGLCVASGGFSSEALLIADAADVSDTNLVCGTADLVAVPALILATDAILVGEEIYAASAIVPDSRRRRAMLHGHDACRALVIAIIVVLVLADWLAAVTGSPTIRSIAAVLASPFGGGI
ncbi:MAG: DUF6754 domain-containing protein [bacterium]